MNPVIYLDMDGVCADFPSAAIASYGQEPGQVFALWKEKYAGKSRDYNVMDLHETDFWKAENFDENFWTNLDEYPWFKDLYNNLCTIAPVVFLSSPGNSPYALSGKLKWLQARFGENFQNYIFTSKKHLLARENTILIDDYEFYVNAFREAGGRAVLFPQIWGCNHHIEDKVDYTINEAKGLLSVS